MPLISIKKILFSLLVIIPPPIYPSGYLSKYVKVKENDTVYMQRLDSNDNLVGNLEEIQIGIKITEGRDKTAVEVKEEDFVLLLPMNTSYNGLRDSEIKITSQLAEKGIETLSPQKVMLYGDKDKKDGMYTASSPSGEPIQNESLFISKSFFKIKDEGDFIFDVRKTFNKMGWDVFTQSLLPIDKSSDIKNWEYIIKPLLKEIDIIASSEGKLFEHLDVDSCNFKIVCDKNAHNKYFPKILIFDVKDSPSKWDYSDLKMDEASLAIFHKEEKKYLDKASSKEIANYFNNYSDNYNKRRDKKCVINGLIDIIFPTIFWMQYAFEECAKKSKTKNQIISEIDACDRDYRCISTGKGDMIQEIKENYYIIYNPFKKPPMNPNNQIDPGQVNAKKTIYRFQ